MAKSKKKGKKRKLNKKRFYTVSIIFLLLVICIYKLLNTNITNIYVSNNEFLTDQDIIDLANLQDYPNSMRNLSYSIKSKLENSEYILSAKVKKMSFISKVYIEVEENYPLFYYQVEDKTVLYNGDKTTLKFSIPTVINQIPNTVYDEFLERMMKVDKRVLNRMSEIQYLPNEVDDERFFVLMNDGNYVYLTLNKFLSINKYIDIIKSFDNKKGILYLDSGEYFDIFDE